MTYAKTKAHIASTIDEEPLPEEYLSEDDVEIDDEYDQYAGVVFVDIPEEATALVADEQPQDFILDSGCNKSHICQSPDLLSNTVKTITNVSGVIAGKSSRTNLKGDLGALGDALHMPDANCNLLSLPVLARKGCTFTGDGKKLIVRDKSGDVILDAPMHHKGFWTVSLTKSKLETFALTADPNAAGGILAMDPLPSQAEEDLDLSPRQLTLEQVKRANAARNLCAVAGHPSVDELKHLLETGRFLHSHPHLQIEDVMNAWRLYGRCSSCTRGKMKAAETKSSHSLPAERVGQVIHMDIVPTPKSLGCEHLLVAVDEKSSYMFSIPLKTKEKAELLRATDSMLAYINQFGHRCEEIRTDHEAAIAACKHEWAARSIRHSKHPPYSHAKRIERHIQTVKTIVACNDADLLYIRPAYLNAAALSHAIYLKNFRRHKNTGDMTPHRMFCPSVTEHLPPWYFGQTGLVYNPKYKTSEWGIFVGKATDSGPAGLKVYIKFPVSNGREGVYVRDKFVADDNIPFKIWGLVSNKNTTRMNAPKLRPEETAQVPSIEPVMPANTIVQTPSMLVPTQRSATPADPRYVPSTPQDAKGAMETTPTPSFRSPPSPPPPPAQKGDDAAAPDAAPPYEDILVLDAPATPPGLLASAPTNEPAAVVEMEQSSPVRRHRRTAAQITADDLKQDERTYLRPQTSGYSTRSKHATVALMAEKDTDVSDKSTQSYTLDYVFKHPDRFPVAPTRAAAVAEFKQLIAMNCMTPVYAKDIPKGEDVTLIPAHAICRDKYHADGSFDKLKCRLVCGGHREDPDHAGETKSPTVNPIVVMTMLQEACQMLRKHPTTNIAAYDIKSAFPNTDVEEGREIYIFTTGAANSIWQDIKPEWNTFINNGKIYFKLNKYLYGLKESPARFNSLLDSVIRADPGFQKSPADQCLYVKSVGEHKIILCVHVDDILCVSTNTHLRKQFEHLLMQRFEIVKQYDTLSYLGLSITMHKTLGTVVVNQTGYIDAVAKRFNLGSLTTTPTVPLPVDIMSKQDPSDDAKVSSRKYLAIVMALMYVGRLTRPDILFGVSFLSTRTKQCSVHDFKMALRILKYLVGTKSLSLRFRYVDPRAPIKVYADASHNLHTSDAVRGHAGLIIATGDSAPIHFRSYKIKTFTRSSSESELVVLDEAWSYLSWLKLLATSLLSCPREIVFYQDNLSTMVMAGGHLSFKNTKHLYGKFVNLRESVAKGETRIEHLPSKEMLADILTKPCSRPYLNQTLVKMSMTYS